MYNLSKLEMVVGRRWVDLCIIGIVPSNTMNREKEVDSKCVLKVNVTKTRRHLKD